MSKGVGWWLMVTYLFIGWRHYDVIIGWRHKTTSGLKLSYCLYFERRQVFVAKAKWCLHETGLHQALDRCRCRDHSMTTGCWFCSLLRREYSPRCCRNPAAQPNTVQSMHHVITSTNNSCLSVQTHTCLRKTVIYCKLCRSSPVMYLLENWWHLRHLAPTIL